MLKETGRIALKQLCVNELYGYDANVELPEYRKIPVILYDKNGDEFRYYPKGSVIPLSEVNKREYYPYKRYNWKYGEYGDQQWYKTIYCF